MLPSIEHPMQASGDRRRRMASLRDLLAGAALLAAVSTSDWITGPGVDFSLFYLAPVCFIAWRCGGRAGYVASVIAAALWLWVDLLTGAKSSDDLLAAWNIVLRLLFFAASVFALDSRRVNEATLTRLVDERTSALQAMALQLSSAEEAERRKLAHAIHDSISQALTIVKINLDAARSQIDSASSLVQRIDTCIAMVEDVLKQTRTLMFDLYPAMLDDLGLTATLMWFGNEFSKRTGVDLAVFERGRPTVNLPGVDAAYLFRAVKELSANAIRHGRAKAIVVTLTWAEWLVRLTIDDDGGGFELAGPTSDGTTVGLGLASIRERIRSMGGTMSVESSRGRGTRVVLEVPISGSAEDKDYAAARLAG